MLGKLLKYELKACARMLLPLYSALLILSLINGLNLRLNTGYNILTGLAITLTAAFSLAIAACSFFLILQRFWQNLLKDEGYLMFTLPVKTSQLILSKLFSGILWVCISGLIGLSAMLLWFAPLNWHVITESLAYLPDFISLANQQLAVLHMNLPLAILQGLVFFLALGAYQILIIYCSMAVGQLPLVSKHRVLASFGAYLLIHFTLQNLTILVSRIFGSWTPLHNWLQNLNPHLGISLLIILLLMLCSLFFGLTHYLLKNQLNLE